MKSCVSTIHTPVHAPVVQERETASSYAPLSRHQQGEGSSAVISIQLVTPYQKQSITKSRQLGVI
jgi:hypothetical protein